VLERETPVSIQLEGRALLCDGQPLASGSTPVEASLRDLKVGATHCNQVEALGDVKVSVGPVRRQLPGLLRLTLEGSVVRLINVVDVEDYLPSVLGAEAQGLAPAAQEAQAIVSRTFALTGRRRHQQAGYHLCDLAHCQVYRGQSETSAQARSAVAATAGQVLLVGGIVLKPAFFHASCGGHTSTGADVFGQNAAGSAVSDLENGVPRCLTPDFAWTFDVEKLALAKAMGRAATGRALEPLRRDAGGRLLEVRVFGKRMSGEEFSSRFRHAFGWQALRSTKFSATETDTSLHLEGTGLGHGVGLCQRGAHALAQRGLDAQGILARYFPEAQVKPAPP
jgi:stage II sporulation protein D